MTYVATHALGIALLLLLFHATGWLVARRWRALDNVGQRTGLIPMAIGIAVWMYLLMALASVGLLRRGVIIGIAVAIGIASLGVWRSPEGLRHYIDLKTASGRSPWTRALHVLAWLPPAVVLAQLFVRTLGPWLGWDDMTAHLTLPKIYLEHGGFRRLPLNVYSHWPSNVQLIYGLGLAVGDYVLAKLLHLAFLALLTVAVYRFAARAAAPWTGVVAASLLLANDVVLVEAPVANIDIAVAFFFFMAVTLAVEFRETGRRASLVLSGLFCGCVAGSKITGLGAIACVFPLVVLGSLKRGQTPFSTSPQKGSDPFSNGALFVSSAFALALPWLVKSYVYTGDPLYPVLWKYFGGIEWSDALHEQFWQWQNRIGMGRTPRDYLLLPVRVILYGGEGYENFAAWISKTWIVFLPLTLVFIPWVPVARRCLLPALLYFIVWAFSSQQSRFLISVLPLLAVATAVTASWVVDGTAKLASTFLTRGRWVTAIRVGLASVVIAGAVVVLGWASRYVRAGSMEATRNLIVDPPNIREWTPDPAFTFVRQQLPRSAKVLMLNINHGFFLDRDYIADSFFEASQLNELITAAHDREGLARLFERLGVTHVMVDQAPWVRFPPQLWSYVRDSGHARILYRSPHSPLRVYELTRESRP